MLHVFVLPVVVLLLFAYHMWRIRKDGGLAAIEPSRSARTPRVAAATPSKSYSIFGVTRGTSIQTLSTTALEEEDVASPRPSSCDGSCWCSYSSST